MKCTQKTSARIQIGEGLAEYFFRKDKECGGEMVKVGGIGKDIELVDHKGRLEGIKEITLYQCPSCKTVVLE